MAQESVAVGRISNETSEKPLVQREKGGITEKKQDVEEGNIWKSEQCWQRIHICLTQLSFLTSSQLKIPTSSIFQPRDVRLLKS